MLQRVSGTPMRDDAYHEIFPIVRLCLTDAKTAEVEALHILD